VGVKVRFDAHMLVEEFMQTDEIQGKAPTTSSRRKQGAGEEAKQLPEDYDSDEEDDDFNAEAAGGEEGEDEGDDESGEAGSSDEEMDELSDSEVKELK
jgi:hypothetical protein